MKVSIPKAPKMKMPTMGHIPRPPKPMPVHPAAQMHVRLPQGEVDTRAGDPGVTAPGIGRF
ncbi:MAG TPA: hypothetical protein VMH26_18275 [Burkholderiales bacterium]|nr:hypothetical protein [Burkholderiales bacterium]